MISGEISTFQDPFQISAEAYSQGTLRGAGASVKGIF